jgi:hypothetical protein
MKHRYKFPKGKMGFKKACHIINTIYKVYPTLFTEEEIRQARIELGIIEEEEI